MKKILNIYKPQGMTPLEIVKLVKEKFPEYKNEPIGYAGRLDPLAHGVLLLMVGEETTKEKDTYLNLKKEYEFEIVFGVSTDTYDALGLTCHPESHRDLRLVSGSLKQKMSKIPVGLKQVVTPVWVQHDIEGFTKSKLGKQIQTYPPFSSKTVAGKPLFWWTKNNKLAEIEIPKKEIEIYDFTLTETKTISAKILEEKIMQQISSVQGDFRQDEIKKNWEDFFNNNCHPESHRDLRLVSGYHEIPPHRDLRDQVRNDKIKEFQTARFKISCSSGTYVRSLTNTLGEKLGIGAITLEILRTKVGEYKLEEAIKLT